MRILSMVFAIALASHGTCAQSIWVGSTPADEPIKRLLKIPSSTKVDFIRWTITFSESADREKLFSLVADYGESKPNTLGFLKTNSIRAEGKCSLESVSGKSWGQVLELQSRWFSSPLRLAILTTKFYHILNENGTLMVGNGGWSYSLSPHVAGDNGGELLRGIPLEEMKLAGLVTFDGRTPCQPFARDHGWKVSPQCFKLKWRLILDSEKKTFTVRRVVGEGVSNLTGSWTTERVSGSSGEILTLVPDGDEREIHLVAGDENVIFLMSPGKIPYVGNADFSFALNRRSN